MKCQVPRPAHALAMLLATSLSLFGQLPSKASRPGKFLIIKLARTINAPSVVATAISSDGRLLAWAGQPRSVNDPSEPLRIVDVGTGEVTKTLNQFRGSITALAFSRDGSTLASGDEGDRKSSGANGANDTLKMWSVETGLLLRTFKGLDGSAQYVSFSPDGKILATSDYALKGQVKLWNVQTGAILKKFSPTPHVGAVGPAPLRFSPDGRILAVQNGAGKIEMWNIITGRIVSSVPQWGAFGFSKSGRLMAIGGRNGLDEIGFWDLRGRLVRTIPDSRGVSSVEFFPGDTVVVAGGSFGVKLWNVANGRLLRVSPLTVDVQTEENIVLSQDGSTLAGACFPGGFIKIWKVSGFE